MAIKTKQGRALQVRMSEAQYEMFQRAAIADGRTLSGWARRRLQEAALAELAILKKKDAGPRQITTTRTTSIAQEE